MRVTDTRMDTRTEIVTRNKYRLRINKQSGDHFTTMFKDNGVWFILKDELGETKSRFRLTWVEMGRLYKVLEKCHRKMLSGQKVTKEFKIYEDKKVYVKDNVVHLFVSRLCINNADDVCLSSHKQSSVGCDYVEYSRLADAVRRIWECYRGDGLIGGWKMITQGCLKRLNPDKSFTIKPIYGSTHYDERFKTLESMIPRGGKIAGFFMPTVDTAHSTSGIGMVELSERYNEWCLNLKKE